MIAALPETTRKLPVIKGRVQTPDIPDSLRGSATAFNFSCILCLSPLWRCGVVLGDPDLQTPHTPVLPIPS